MKYMRIIYFLNFNLVLCITFFVHENLSSMCPSRIEVYGWTIGLSINYHNLKRCTFYRESDFN